MPQKPDTLEEFAAEVVRVFSTRPSAGCYGEYAMWTGYCNGNGTEVGAAMDRLIRKAKRLSSPAKSNAN